MRVYLTYGCLLIIFFSMLFSLLIFQKLSSLSSGCGAAGCSDPGFTMTVFFGFFMAGAFVAVDCVAFYLVIKEATVESRVSEPKQGNTLKSLREEVDQLKLSKKEVESQYYKGRIDAKMFEDMLRDYNKMIIETESKIKAERRRNGKS